MKDFNQIAAFAKRIEIVAQELAVDPEIGLDETEIVERRNRYGPNQLRAHAKQSVFVILAHQFKGVIVWLLAFAAGLSFYFHDIAEGVAIVVVLAINAVIGFGTELRAARSMEALLSIATVTTRVRRGGKAVRIDAHDLVPGDLVLLDAGDIVAADMRLDVLAGDLGAHQQRPRITGDTEFNQPCFNDRVDHDDFATAAPDAHQTGHHHYHQQQLKQNL